MSDLFGGALFHAFNQLFTAFSSLAQAQHSLPAAILNSWKVHAALNIEVQKSQRTIDKGEAEHQKNNTLLRRASWGNLHFSAQRWYLDSGHPHRISPPDFKSNTNASIFFYVSKGPPPPYSGQVWNTTKTFQNDFLLEISKCYYWNKKCFLNLCYH